MSMKELIKVHAEIEQQNRKNVKRWKAKEIYRRFIRNGQFFEGREILRLLRNGSVTLWLGDTDWNVQTALEDAGFHIWFSRDGYKAVARI